MKEIKKKMTIKVYLVHQIAAENNDKLYLMQNQKQKRMNLRMK